MSGHVVDMNVSHPIKEQNDRETPFALRADCPYCGAFPGKPCWLKDWTHPARTQRARELDRDGRLQPKKILNDLPEEIKKALVAYCKDKGIAPLTLNDMTTDQLFEIWCNQMGLHFWGKKMLIVYEAFREIRG